MEQLVFEFGTNRNPIVVGFKEYNGQKLADIRKYYIDKEDPRNKLPTKKGISLNRNQLGLLLNIFKEHSSEISAFFENDPIEIEIDIKSTIGRIFSCLYVNNDVIIEISEEVAKRMNSYELNILCKSLEAFNSALHDVLEDEDEINMILDMASFKLSRSL